LAATAGYLFFIRTLPPDVEIAGVDVGGMNFRDAYRALNKAQQNYRQNSLTIEIEGEEFQLTYADTGIELNRFSAVWSALWNAKADEDFDVSKHLDFNKKALNTQLDAYTEHFASSLMDNQYEVQGERPDLTANEVTGEHQTFHIIKGTPDAALDKDMLHRAILSSYNEGKFRLNFPLSITPPAEPDWDALYKEYCAEPISAEMDMETFEVSKHSYGYAFDLEKAKESYKAAKYGEEIVLEFAPVKPELLQEELKAVLFRDVLGSYTAVSSSQYNRDINLRLACQSLNGKILNPGQTISYNQTLGKRTPEKGYRPAASYFGSETVTTYGGGICQPSSCLYLAALYADIEIVERHNHGFVSSYTPLGMDATVDWSGPDLKIKNNTKYPIRIEAWSSGGSVTVRLIGTDTRDYYVKMTYSVLSRTDYKTKYVEMEANNSKGYKDGEVIVTPYTGYRVNTFKHKFDKETNELISSEFEASSNYAKRDKEICKIKPKQEAPKPTTPPTTTPPTTAPTETTTPPTETTAPPSEETNPGIDGVVGEDG
jgi:vancomycin resistance protein YoaR